MTIYHLGDLSKGAALLGTAIRKGHDAALYLMNVLHARLENVTEAAIAVNPPETYRLYVTGACAFDSVASCREMVVRILVRLLRTEWECTGALNITGLLTPWSGLSR